MSFQGMGKSIYPMCTEKPGAASAANSRRSSVQMSLQPAIPWRVGLHQSPPPLHRPGSECATVVLPVEKHAANGDECLNRLCQPRGQPQTAAIKSAFYDYFYFDKAIQATNQNKELLEKLSKIAEAQYRVGQAMQQDVLRSQVEISRSRAASSSGTRPGSRPASSAKRRPGASRSGT